MKEDEGEGWLCDATAPLLEPFAGNAELKFYLANDPKPSEFF